MVRSEGAGYFLVDPGHLDVVFPLIVGKRGVGAVHEPQGFGFEADEPSEEIEGFTLFDAPFLASWLNGLWSFGVSRPEDLSIGPERGSA